MPRYFFHVDGSTSDTVGVELDSFAVAKCEAVKVAGQLICENASVFWDTHDFTMNVADDAGLTLFSLMFVGIEAAAAALYSSPSVGSQRPS